jgi:hypothetical protein
MRRMMLVLGMVTVLVPLVGVAALAVTGKEVQCRSVPCYGAKGDDKILERRGDGKQDVIVPKGGDDLILANKYTKDHDVVRRGGGNDKINVADGDKLDLANGGKGYDVCIVDAKREAGTSCAKVLRR